MSEQPTQALRISIITPYGIFYDANCELLVIPSPDGEIGIMHGHTPMVSAIYPGELRFLQNGEWQSASISNGFAHIERDYALVITNAAEWPEHIDVARVEAAETRAQERLSQQNLTERERSMAKHALRRAKARYLVLERHQRKKKDRHT